MSERYDAIIVGGGHNGLVTAAYLGRAGRRVLVLERRELVGGCAVTEEIWPGYRVSTAAYLTSLLQPRIVAELELERHGYRVDAKDPAFFSAFPDGRHFFMWQDRRKTLDEIAKRYELDPKGLRAANPGLKEKEKNNEKVLASGQSIFLPGVQEIKTVLSNLHQGEPGFRGYRNDHNTGTGAQRLEASRSLIGQFGSRVGALSWPAAGQISSPFGIRGYSFHPGMDICNNVGTPIHAAKGGVVVSSGWMGDYGNAIDVDHGGGIVTRYGHCSKLLVPVGKKVEAGEQIALMGSTGYSTGPHVHFEVRIQGRAVNPASFL